MDIKTQVESYKFWDVVSLWGRETLEHDVIVARKLAKGVIKTGLRFQSANPKWLKSNEELLSYPYIGYTSIPKEGPIIIKAEVLAHLINVAEEKVDPSEQILKDEVVLKNDLKMVSKDRAIFPEVLVWLQ